VDGVLRIGVRVRSGASRDAVGGRYGHDALVVAVTARAVDGAASRAVVAAMATAFGLHRADVEIVNGATARSKTLALRGDPAVLERRRRDLLGP
jgi:uncharacterized protein (TIGR00251 family)